MFDIKFRAVLFILVHNFGAQLVFKKKSFFLNFEKISKKSKFINR